MENNTLPNHNTGNSRNYTTDYTMDRNNYNHTMARMPSSSNTWDNRRKRIGIGCKSYIHRSYHHSLYTDWGNMIEFR